MQIRRGTISAPLSGSKQIEALVHTDSGYTSDARLVFPLEKVEGDFTLTLNGPLPSANHVKVQSELSFRGGQRRTLLTPGVQIEGYPAATPISHDKLAAEVEGTFAGLVRVKPECINIDACQAASPTSQLDSSTKVNARRSALILQPDSSPISQDQLAAEVKGIYAGLLTVEARCINIDVAQAADLISQLGQEQWQALIALHRTLLYEHHDFLMATQHPSATPALRGLATKYAMPARMWKHGIHAFLEVLRHRRPESHDYMLAFIYLAYQMMGLLYETVPAFQDTWIECLGDLARYRMAIEEESHAGWGGVAASWYTKAADEHPQIGRLYHHLGVLERPGLRKFACYGKSLTCVVPFSNARDSMAILCKPIVEETDRGGPGQSTAAIFCKLHVLIFLGKDQDTIPDAQKTAFYVLERPAGFRWRDFGAPLAVTNISALLGYEIGSALHSGFGHDASIENAIRRPRSSTTFNTSQPSANLTRVLVENKERLPEDYHLRGLLWSYLAFRPGWFQMKDGDEGNYTVETASTDKASAKRTGQSIFQELLSGFSRRRERQNAYFWALAKSVSVLHILNCLPGVYSHSTEHPGPATIGGHHRDASAFTPMHCVGLGLVVYGLH